MEYYTNPYFSVVIPTYNRKGLVSLAVKSVLNQTLEDFEIIVVDDGSIDGTGDAIASFIDKRIRYIYQTNGGVSSARNKGLELSRGKHIAFLDSDDRWTPVKLERTFEYIQKHPGICIFHTEELWYRYGKLLNQKKIYKKPDGYVYNQALPLCCISFSTAVIHRNIFQEIGVFDEALPACEDYDFWLRATLKNRVKLIPERLTIKYGGRPDQLSAHHSLDKYRIYSLQKMLDNHVLDDEQYKNTREELIKKCMIFTSGTRKRGKKQETEYYSSIAKRY